MRNEITYLFWLSCVVFLSSAWDNVAMSFYKLITCLSKLTNLESSLQFTVLILR